MPKVICKLPNASHTINGFKFTPHPDGHGMVSEELPEEHAAHFASIEGYKIVGAKAKEAEPAKAAGKQGARAKAAAAPAQPPAPKDADSDPLLPADDAGAANPDGDAAAETGPAPVGPVGAAGSDPEIF